MTTLLQHADAAGSTRPRVFAAALGCIVAGVLGFASGVLLAVVEPAVGEDRFSYPLTADGFSMAQAWFAVHHLGLLAGLLGLAWAGVLPASRLATSGWRLAVAGMVGLTVTEVAAIAVAGDTADTTAAQLVGGLYGLDCLLLGVGLVMAGIAVVRAGTWTGWRRWVVLALGTWVFVPMFPALVATPTDGARWAIGGWMLLFGLLGLALLEPGRAGRRP